LCILRVIDTPHAKVHMIEIDDTLTDITRAPDSIQSCRSNNIAHNEKTIKFSMWIVQQ